MKWLWKGLLHMHSKANKIVKDERGQALSEYAIIIGVIAVLIIVTLIAFRSALVGLFERIITAISGAGT